MCLLVVASIADAYPIHFLSSILVNCVRALVLMDGGVLACRVIDLVFFAGAVVTISGFVLEISFSFLIFCLATGVCSTLRTTGMDTVENCWVICVIALV